MPANAAAVSVRVKKMPASAAGGLRSHDLRLGRVPPYVSSAASHRNSVLIEPLPAPQLRQLSADLRSRKQPPPKRAMRSTAAPGWAGIVTFGRDAAARMAELEPSAQDAALRAAAEAAAGELGTVLTGLVVHRDEAELHAHFQFPAYTGDGRPLTSVVKPRLLSRLQDAAAGALREFCPGIERGSPKRARLEAGENPADLAHRSVRELHVGLGLRPGAGPDEVSAAVADKRRAELEAAEVRAALEQEKTEAQAELSLQRARTDAERDAARRAAAARKEAEEAEAAADARRMSPGNLFTGGLRRREQAALDIEADARTRAEELERQAEADRRAREDWSRAAEAELSARREELEREAAEALSAEAERCGLAVQAITEGIANPAEDAGGWLQGPRYDKNLERWRQDFAPVLLPEKPRPWPAAVWRGLRALAAALAEPLRKLNVRLQAALTARKEAENALAAAVGTPEQQGTHVPREQLAAAESTAASLRGEIAGLKERLEKHEPPEPAADDSPSFGM